MDTETPAAGAHADETHALTTCQPVLRFAPSPNGFLHAGHALSALTVWRMAKRLGGRFLLRIEDIDPTRNRQKHVDGIYRDLEWLGVEWEEPVLRQSTRFDAYREAASRLATTGLLYPCFASRTEIAETAYPGLKDPDGAPLYSGLHRSMPVLEAKRRIAAGERPAMRLDMQGALARLSTETPRDGLTITEFDDCLLRSSRSADPGRWGDAVLQRKEAPTSYHLSVVVDDAWQGITHVVRGLDLLASTDLHRLLQHLLEFPSPLYHHHRLIMGEGGRKLSKSARDISLAALREAGMTVRDIQRMVGYDPETP
jgi:glutamyl-Q tRNA(Asp) synthetase